MPCIPKVKETGYGNLKKKPNKTKPFSYSSVFHSLSDNRQIRSAT